MDRRRIRALRLKPGPTAPHLARNAIRQLLAGCDSDAIDRALLITSEAVTNAVIHAATEITVNAEVVENRLRVDIEDGDEQIPVPRTPRGARGGFGLHVIGQLASRWGVAPRDNGKAVWFELSLVNTYDARREYTVGNAHR
jgi:anti-sigma regulatory factor (Ser/Thr protein kinase)